jgi:hypothetical protein
VARRRLAHVVQVLPIAGVGERHARHGLGQLTAPHGAPAPDEAIAHPEGVAAAHGHLGVAPDGHPLSAAFVEHGAQMAEAQLAVVQKRAEHEAVDIRGLRADELWGEGLFRGLGDLIGAEVQRELLGLGAAGPEA